MPFTIIVGGQFGSEGKGKVTAYLCQEHQMAGAVRCGGPNSGHTITVSGEQVILRQLPAGVVNPSTKLFLAAGCLLDLNVLLREVDKFGLDPSRLRIDRRAAVIGEDRVEEERRLGLRARIGSTGTGTGATVAKRALRDGGLRFAADIPELRPYVADVSEELMKVHASGGRIVIEGTQGYGLSVYHSPYYPFATSRDTTAAGFLSEVGVSPLVVSDIIMVIRTFPIRVGGNSGPLPQEVNWETVREESAYPIPILEHTSVTNTVRRVARFDFDIVKRAALANSPTHIALMGADYLDYRNRGVTDFEDLTEDVRTLIERIERVTGSSVTLVGTGPLGHELIERFRVQQTAQREGTRRTEQVLS